MPCFSRPVLLTQRQLTVSPHQPFAIDYPELTSDRVICIGLSIAWQHAEALHIFSLRHTHAEEQANAARFHRREDGLRHLLGRALLRHLAMHYGGMAPGQRIPVNAWGKPEPMGQSLGCNVAHSGSQVWAAIARTPNIGIDVEAIAAVPDALDIVTDFHPSEVAALQEASDMPGATMRCWTRKEAVCKAVGLGFAMPLADYAVDCGSARENWLRVAPSGTRTADWTTMDLTIGDGYGGALAMEGRCDEVAVIRLNIGEPQAHAC